MKRVLIVIFWFTVIVAVNAQSKSFPGRAATDSTGRKWAYIIGYGKGDSLVTLYDYTQENRNCASFTENGRTFNVNIVPDTKVYQTGRKEVYTTCYDSKLPPALNISGVIFLLIKGESGELSYCPQLMLNKK